MTDQFLTVNQVRVSGNSILFTGGSQSGHVPVGGAIAKRPFTRKYPYVELTIEEWGENGAIGIGASIPSYSAGQMPGWRSGSVGFHADDGKLFDSTGSGREFCTVSLAAGSVMGCGVVFDDNAKPKSVYFTVDGAVIGSTSAPKDSPVLHPHFGFHSVGEKIAFNLKARSPMTLAGSAAGYLARRTVPAPKGERQLQELGLKFFASLVQGFTSSSGAGAGEAGAGSSAFATTSALAGPLQAVSDVLCAMPSRALFNEWTPPREPAQMRFDLKQSKAAAFASATDSSSNAAGNALTAGSSHWKANEGTKSHWGVKLNEEGTAVFVSSVEIEWETSSRKCIPEWFELQISTDGDTYTTAKEVRGAAAKLDKPGQYLWLNTSASHIRVVIYGHSSENKDKYHGIRLFTVNTVDKSQLHSTSADNLSGLRSWMASLATTPDDNVCGAALRGLQALALTSGSLSTVLRLAKVLLAQPSRAMPQPTVAHTDKFAKELESYVTDVHNKASLREMAEGAAASSGDGGGGWGELPRTFDPDHKPSGLNLTEGNMVVACTSGSGVMVLNGEPFTTGKAAWEFNLVQDSNGGQCTCFGAAMCRPVTSQSYNSAQCWMYRSYNGYHYQNGRQVGSATRKVKTGETVRIEIDMDAGTMRYIIEGEDQGIVFDNLAGNEVYPAVAFYSSGRTIKLVKVEGPTGGGSSGGAVPTTPLISLDERDTSVGYGSFSKGDTLGYDSIQAKVGKNNVRDCISMHPPANEQKDDDDTSLLYSRARFDLAKKYEKIKGKVAINADVDLEKLRSKGSKATFTLLADDEVVWTSNPTQDLEPQEFTADILGTSVLELRVQVEGSNDLCHAIWYDCQLDNCREWKSDGWNNEADSFVCPINGATRGKPTPIPAVATGDNSTAAGLALTTLSYCGVLANEYLRNMKALAGGRDGFASVDLEEPFSVEACGETFALVKDLLDTVLTTKADHYVDSAIALLRIARANLRRVIVSQVDPAKIGIYREVDESDSKEAPAEGDSKTEEKKTVNVLEPLAELLVSIVNNPDLPSELRAEASEVEEAGLELLLPQASQRDSRTRSLMTDDGVIELQLAWPCNAVDALGDAVKFERVLLLLQLEARKLSWKVKVLGRWPAVVYLVLEVPGDVGVANFLEKRFAEILSSAEIEDWSFPDGLTSPELRVQVERLGGWSRRQRLITETGVGMLRVYPSGVASFDDVCQSIRSFLPPITLATKEVAPAAAEAGAGAGVGVGAGAGAA